MSPEKHLARETARSLFPSRPGPLAAGPLATGREVKGGERGFRPFSLPVPFPFPKAWRKRGGARIKASKNAKRENKFFKRARGYKEVKNES